MMFSRAFRLALLTAFLVNFSTFIHAKETTQKTLPAFSSERELRDFFDQTLFEEMRKQAEEQQKAAKNSATINPSAPQMKMQESAQDSVKEFSPSQPSSSAKMSTAKASGETAESITNVQHAGVDEGGIVKQVGDFLVILRRGRLFTVRIEASNHLVNNLPNDLPNEAQKPLASIDMSDAFGEDINPSGTWYDEILIDKNNIFVIGYSYARGGTEIGLFNIDKKGQLSYRSTWHLRSADYYSANNFASRLVDGKLVFYAPIPVNFWAVSQSADQNFRSLFPAIRKWRKNADFAKNEAHGFTQIAPATQVYKPLPILDLKQHLALHSVTSCAVKNDDLDCVSRIVIAPQGRVFYVSPEAVYIWTNGRYNNAKPADFRSAHERVTNESVLYRLPFNHSAPTALRVTGAPIDQFSFLESEKVDNLAHQNEKQLNVFIGKNTNENSNGESMWNAVLPQNRGDFALLQIPLSAFSDGSEMAKPEHYRALAGSGISTLKNRFVGDYLLYGSAGNTAYSGVYGKSGKGSAMRNKANEGDKTLYATNWKKSDSTSFTLPLGHGVERIEALGFDAIIIGAQQNNLLYTSISLQQAIPKIASQYVQQNAAQGESRSHGFFYQAGDENNAKSGLLGLPILRGDNPRGNKGENRPQASIVFLQNNNLQLAEIGQLAALNTVNTNDSCRASCVDWYGNARPIFFRGRILGLLGYEIVEGARDKNGNIGEINRLDFSPKVGNFAR